MLNLVVDEGAAELDIELIESTGNISYVAILFVGELSGRFFGVLANKNRTLFSPTKSHLTCVGQWIEKSFWECPI
jgi:hypothetical protein